MYTAVSVGKSMLRPTHVHKERRTPTDVSHELSYPSMRAVPCQTHARTLSSTAIAYESVVR